MTDKPPSVDRLPLDEESRSFDEPWQAQAFALVVALHKSGKFTWEEWVKTFSSHIKAEPARPGESTNDTYYRQWMLALEEMANSLGDLTTERIDERVGEWRQAYLNTPHGNPVLLINASCPPKGVHHHHAPKLKPVAISSAAV
ncbi:nitrile hydratase accessory protein [Phaeobacter gallaeciensis]|uniref:nitrile hydratase accessory protein n=1 Tax=Phaeobacter gallaeciensis TaxID=60890 RepID=UPI00237F8598|nr:nitrile hydratase accessory protein [Phaeobacter gallaeciensis]MDE4305822.1 nitrile hydratase accessory protein [Phaeobacter gallaeciensis]MDE4310197.1 nitrile hydratase accessory protein [Phaeobacter gallaeciensis]MDE4314709.1 nitrile hydratase accessory protein [Phaeobacter gallaeciensis]MDE4319100.1 nitrile hydratase accessory protein [Phaeobacter gallaeciensis]MDE4323572.1 nitrile hydratase accessory protein [Phaeobacter gallaeciensis]